jgi:hypothetical protein
MNTTARPASHVRAAMATPKSAKVPASLLAVKKRTSASATKTMASAQLTQ